MRLVIAGLALALALPAAGVPCLGMAVAQVPVATQPLAVGEVLLEVNGMGTVTTRADLATLLVPISVGGANEAEATVDRIAAAAASVGVGADDIVRHPITTGDPTLAFTAREPVVIVPSVPEGGSSRRPPLITPSDRYRGQVGASSQIEIRLRDISRFEQLRSAIKAAGAAYVPEPVYALTDDRGARAEARARALAQARANADGYASALGMRVVRVVRVTERVGVDLIGAMISEGPRMRRMMSGVEGRNPEISTTIALGMDFALAPR